MNILAYLYTTPPHRYLGAERMMGRLLRVLADAGHEVSIVTDVDHGSYMWGGIPVDYVMNQIMRPDVFISIPELGARGRHLWFQRPYVCVGHNTSAATFTGLDHARPDVMVANTEAMAGILSALTPVVIHPPLDEEFMDEPGESTGTKITLVNLSVDKGALVFYAMARACPDLPFLGVMGGHGPQVGTELPNVDLSPQTASMGLVYEQTKILLVPSYVESYGMVAAEATSRGIPVVARDLPGLHEVLGPTGIYTDFVDLQRVANGLRSLMHHNKHYAPCVVNARERGSYLRERTTTELEQWTDLIASLG